MSTFARHCPTPPRSIVVLLRCSKTNVTSPPTALVSTFARHCPNPPRSIVASSRLWSRRTLACRLPQPSVVVARLRGCSPSPSALHGPSPSPSATSGGSPSPFAVHTLALRLPPRPPAAACGASAPEANMRLTPYRRAAILLNCMLRRAIEPGDIVAHPRGDESLSASACLFSRLGTAGLVRTSSRYIASPWPRVNATNVVWHNGNRSCGFAK
jgi:hypothetical protein